MLTKKERAAQLAARGYKGQEIIDMIGVSRVWLNRMTGSDDAAPDPEFVAYLHAYRGDPLAPEELEYIDIDDPKWAAVSRAEELEVLTDKYNRLEHRAVDALHDSLALAMDPKVLMGVLNTISSRQASLQKAAPLVQINQQFNNGTKIEQVTLTLPKHALGMDALQLSTNNEVMAIDGRSLSSLTAQETSAIIEDKRAERNQAHSETVDMETEFPDL